MERKELFRAMCALGIAGVGTVLFGSILSSCGSTASITATIVNHTITIPLASLADTDLTFVHPEEFPYSIAVEKQSDGYRALLLRCTRADNPVNYSGVGFTCPIDGSTFDLNGEVTRGPASFPLKRLETEIQEE